jgi:hypothetical protein
MKKQLLPLGLIPFLLSGCTPPQDKAKTAQQALDALAVTLEANLKYREVQSECGFGPWKKELVSKVALVPINKEVIDATLRLKAAREEMSPTNQKNLEARNYQAFVNGDRTTFMLIVVNNDKLDFGKDRIFIDQPNQYVVATSQNKQYKLIDYTTSLGTNLNPGWNDGYLHFQNFRKNRPGLIKDYSVHINSMSVICDGSNTASQPWAFSFDDSDLNYLSLIQQGLTKDQVREKYNLNAFTYLKMNNEDIGNLVKLVFKFVK